MNSKRPARGAAALTVVLALAMPAYAAQDELEDPMRIRDAAEQAVREAAGSATADLVVTADPTDPRLRLARCPATPHGQVVGGGPVREHTTVAVRCEGGTHWLVYTSVAVSTDLPVLVARRALPRDAVPTPADFTVVVRRVPGTSALFISDPAQLAGKRLLRPIGVGEVLSADALLTAPVVRRGQQVLLLAHAGGMDVRVTVVALMDGRPEERIRVQNPGSQRVVEATVRNSELVEIAL
jgi:flagella basal body P-ring formation protein FlgA